MELAADQMRSDRVVARACFNAGPGAIKNDWKAVQYFSCPNQFLATLDSGDPRAAGEWAAYRASWTRWNHVRVVLALGSAVLLAAALHG